MDGQDRRDKSLPPPPRPPNTVPSNGGLDTRQFKYAPPPSLSQNEQVSRAAGQPKGSQHNPISLLDGIPEVKKAKELYHSFQNFIRPQKQSRRPPSGINGANSTSHPGVQPGLYQAPQAMYQGRPFQQTYNQTGPAYVPGPFANRPPGQPLRPTDPGWKNATTAAELKYDRMNYTTPVPPNSIDLTSAESDTYVDPVKAQDEIKQLVESLQEVDESTALPDNPKDLTVNLLKHQQMGLSFMKARETGPNKNGGILADDMGLGKTIQTLALILENRPTNPERKTTLIVAPLALIRQWESEINTKTKPGTLKVLVHHGPGRTKSVVTMRKHDVVITTYQVVVSEWPSPPKKPNKKSKSLATPKSSSNIVKRTPRRVIDSSDEEASADASDDSYPSDDSFTESSNSRGSSKAPTRNGLTAAGPLFEMDFFRVVLDEAQTIKNRSSKASQACSKIRSDKRWCLTGTPIQNTVDDLYSLFRFLRIKPYDDYPTFKTQIVSLVAQGRGKLAMRRLHVILKAIMLRRTKTTLIDGKPLLQLPKRTVHSVIADFSKEEREFYDALENRTKLTLNKFVTAGTVNNNYTNILCLLLRLRQACNHPDLVTRSFNSDPDAIEARPAAVSVNDKEVDDVADLLQGLSVDSKSKVTIQRCDICLEELQKEEIFATRPLYCKQCAPKMELQRQVQAVGELIISTKIERMMNVLQQTRQRDATAKTIIFSQFTSMLDLIEPFLKKQGHKFARYDGSMPNAKREASLDALRGDSATTILLISLKCGSLGLNLTAAEQVILLDVWWNPSVEDQAVDRAHRIGQLRDVNVYKITIKDTVEDRILVLQENKRKLAEGALGDGDKAKSKLNKLSIRDIMYLFRHDSKDAESDED